MLDGADYRELPANGGVDDLMTTVEDAQEAPKPALAALGRQARAQLREPPSAMARPT